MMNRKILYGYRIRNGVLEIVQEEQQVICRVFTLYNASASYQGISDTLNQQNVPYCPEAPLWNKHKVKRLLENPRYTGKDGYPMIVDADTFQAARDKTEEKNAPRQSHRGKSPIVRLTPYLRCTCGAKMSRLGGGWQESDTLYMKCGTWGFAVAMNMDMVIKESVKQFRAHECPSHSAYVPSAEVMRLNNAIDRGLEQPNSPEAVMSLILQGAAARYDCCPPPVSEYENSDRPTEVDWRRFRRVVSYITVAPDAAVKLTFADDNLTGKDE